MSQSKAVEIFIGYMHVSQTEDALAATLCAYGAGGGLINVEKRHHNSYGFARYTNPRTATQAIKIVC